VLSRLFQERFNQKQAGATSLVSMMHHDGTDLRQMASVKMQRTTADDSALVFSDYEVADVLADFGKAPG